MHNSTLSVLLLYRDLHEISIYIYIYIIVQYNKIHINIIKTINHK